MIQIWSPRDTEWTCRIYEGLAGIAHARWADADTVMVAVDFQRLGRCLSHHER